MGKKSKRKKGKKVKGSIQEGRGIPSNLSRKYDSAIVFFLIIITLILAAYNRNHIWKDDITLWEDVIGKSQGKARGYYNLGSAYDEHGLINAAIVWYRKALRLEPDLVQAHSNLGVAYYSLGLINEAIEEYKLALSLRPFSAEIHTNLGAAHYDQGNIDEAIEEYREALRLKPDTAEIHFNLGLAYKTKGLRNKAIKEFEKVLEIRPDYEEARRALKTLSE
jgi:tetratricopeptide (TPR) repeat protein